MALFDSVSEHLNWSWGSAEMLCVCVASLILAHSPLCAPLHHNNRQIKSAEEGGWSLKTVVESLLL